MMENKTKIDLKNTSIFITGAAGFIGSNLAKRILTTVEGAKVVGLDNMNHYYDVRLKEARLDELNKFENFSFVKGNLADKETITTIFEQYDAIEAGFNHVVFIVRKDIEQEFKEVIGERIKAICSAHDVTVDYAFQDINDIPGTLPEGRTKPWGTGQAVLVAKELLKTPFIVINGYVSVGMLTGKTIPDTGLD